MTRRQHTSIHMDSASVQFTGKIISEHSGIILFKFGHIKHWLELPKVNWGQANGSLLRLLERAWGYDKYYKTGQAPVERRRPENVHGTLTRSITLDIVDMSTMGRQYTEVCESVLPNIPKIDCLVSKLALTFKMIHLILLYS